MTAGKRRPNGSPEKPVRSMRINVDTWERAKVRAESEGVTISNVVAQLIEGWALGLIPTPVVTITYGQTRTEGES